MSLAAMIKGNGPNGFGYGSTAEEVTEGFDLSGKRFLLTGCGSGLGLETMRVLCLRGASVVAAARTEQKAQEALEAVSGKGLAVACELSEPRSVRECAAAIKAKGGQLDGIICNAGIMALPKAEVKYGLELQFLTNHIGHFILVNELLGQLSDTGRVVVVSSAAHHNAPSEGILFNNLDWFRGYTPWKAYGMSKLANILFARQLALRFEGSKRTANALHPGVIATNLSRHMNPLVNRVFKLGEPLFLKSIPQGAATQCYLAVHPEVQGVSGQYFKDCNQASTSRQGNDLEAAARLWKASEAIVARL